MNRKRKLTIWTSFFVCLFVWLGGGPLKSTVSGVSLKVQPPMAALNLAVEGFVWEAEPEGGVHGKKRERKSALLCNA